MNKQATGAAHESDDRHSALQLFKNYDVCEVPEGATLYVDDIFTQGRHLAAIDESLGRPKAAGAIGIGFTDSGYRETCLSWRAKRLEYSEIASYFRGLVDDDA